MRTKNPNTNSTDQHEKIRVLIVESDEEYSQLIQESLQSAEFFQVRSALSGSQAIAFCQKMNFEVLIVDFSLPDIRETDLFEKLRALCEPSAVIAIPQPETDEKIFEGFTVDEILREPFSLTELPSLVTQVLERQRKAGFETRPEVGSPDPSSLELEERIPKIPTWLMEKSLAQEWLGLCSSKISARGVLLARGQEVWASSGNLNASQILFTLHEMLEVTSHQAPTTILTRYIQLPDEERQSLLCILTLPSDLAVGTTFSRETPFRLAHQQTQLLRDSLLRRSAPQTTQTTPSEIVGASPKEALTQPESTQSSDWVPLVPVNDSHLPHLDAPGDQPSGMELSSEEFGEKPKPETPRIQPGDWKPKEPRPSSHFPFLEETMPRKIPASLDQEVRYDLPVTTVLFPRFPNHQLTQSIGAKLAVWIPKLCIAWGWRATSVEIRPTHLQMTLRLSPEVAPAQAIQRIARDLSHQILRTFPHLARDLPSQRFWAKGYLLTTGTSLDPKHTRAFLKKIRRNQGLNS